jgi:hypothetical protein
VDRVEWLKDGLRAFHIGIFLIESHLPFPVAYSTSISSLTHSCQSDVTSLSSDTTYLLLAAPGPLQITLIRFLTQLCTYVRPLKSKKSASSQ